MTITKELLDKLKHQEALTVSGAPSNTPKQEILKNEELQAKLLAEGKTLRWVNIKDANKVASRKAQGYVRLSESEGGRQLGDEFALFVIPTVQVEQRVARQKKMNEERLSSYKDEMQQMAENIAKILRDKHGIKVDPTRLFTDEGG